MALSAGKVFQFEHVGSPAREVFKIRMPEHQPFATMRLNLAHHFQGVADILDRLKLDRRHDCIAGYMTHAGNPASRLGGGVKGFEYHPVNKLAPANGRGASALTINPVVNLAIEGDTLWQSLSPIIGNLDVDSTSRPEGLTIPICPAPVIFLAGDPSVNTLTGIVLAVLKVCFVHRGPRVGCLASIRLQVTQVCNSIRGIMAGLFWRLGGVMNTRGSLSGGGIRVVSTSVNF